MDPNAYSEMAEIEDEHWWFRGRRTIVSSLLGSLPLPKGSSILEVGCGTGGNLDMLNHFGQVYAFEMSESARQIAQKKTASQYDIRSGYCPQAIPFVGKTFDLICLFDVLEHIEEDKETLSSLSSLLNKNGFIFLTVPAYQWMFGPHDVFLHHRRRYTSRQLSAVARSAGLKPVKLTYINTVLFPLAVVARLKDKISKSKIATGANLPKPLINAIFYQLFAFEKVLLRLINLPFGVSIVGIFQIDDVGPRSE
jgi:SAM-dependent methyltransferase